MDNISGITIPMAVDVKLRIEWRELITNLTNVAVQGFATSHGITDGISNGISALIGAVGAIKAEDDPGEKAWRLFWLSFAWSLDELRASGNTDDVKLRAVVHDAITDASNLVREGETQVPLTFCKGP